MAVVRPGVRQEPRLGAEIVAWSGERLAAYKCPGRFEFPDAFPLGPGGKALQRELTALLGARS
ncbi:hypothetical protein ACWDFR_41340 [Streptomyces sp. 900105755]|uniref:hypothetical protein n=1 Tax=Streptomyces sp. NPDC001507 TaxID=3364579 RepID=UPI0036C75FE9